MSKDLFQDREAKKYKNPIPSREFIIQLLKNRKTPANRDEIAKELNISNEEHQEALRRRLRAMERDGQLVFTYRHSYSLPNWINLLRGKVIGHRDGYGFLCVEGEPTDFYLSSEQMKFCLHGDTILAQLGNTTDRKGRREARVLRVLEPRNDKIVGRYFINSGIGFVIPHDSRLNCNILIPHVKNHVDYIGLVVVVKIIQRTYRRNKIIGKIIEVLGNTMSTGLAIDIALRTHEIPYSWPKEVEKELFYFKREELFKYKIKDRVDIRHLPFVTIDNEDAHDFDDAIYCEKKRNGGGWRLLVAIADVSYYVRPGTALDKEASQRGTSVYFPSKVIPMLPEFLSNHLCSLKVQVDRLCMVCEMNISSKGKLIEYKHYEAIMHSHARLTYDKAWNILQGNLELCKQYAKIVTHLKELYDLYQVLKIAREERGGISFEIEEAKFIFNSERRIERVEPIIYNDAHKLVEECMILANVASAYFVEKNEEPALFRDHDCPSRDSIMSFHTVLKELGLNLSGGFKPQPIDYVELLKKIVNRPDAEMLQTMLLRSMKQAVYASENRGHFGLALSSYAHFTSPIRRYPDLLLHRAIKYLLAKEQNYLIGNATPTGGYHYDIKEMLQLGQHCSMTERRADEATRDAVDWLKCDFMKDQVGNTFDGVISSVTSFGFFVRLNNLFIDGLVHVSTLNNDYYRFDGVSQRLIGESSGIRYQLGDIVKVRVDAVHTDERKIDFTLISNKYLKYKQRKKFCNGEKSYEKRLNKDRSNIAKL